MILRTCADAEPAAEPLGELDQIRPRLSSIDDHVALLEGVLAFSPLRLQVHNACGECLLVNKASRRFFGSEPPSEYDELCDLRPRGRVKSI